MNRNITTTKNKRSVQISQTRDLIQLPPEIIEGEIRPVVYRQPPRQTLPHADRDTSDDGQMFIRANIHVDWNNMGTIVSAFLMMGLSMTFFFAVLMYCVLSSSQPAP
jgi:hypothetical protein